MCWVQCRTRISLSLFKNTLSGATQTSRSNEQSFNRTAPLPTYPPVLFHQPFSCQVRDTLHLRDDCVASSFWLDLRLSWDIAASTSDPRVPLWQCVKYLSRLRARAQEKPTAEPRDAGIWETLSKNIDYVLGKQGHRMIVSDIDEHAGHFGAAGHSAQTASYSLEVAFLHKALGLKLK
jgi:hypothetical protein